MCALQRFREVMGDGADPLISPVSSEGGRTEADQKRKGDYSRKLADIERRLKAISDIEKRLAVLELKIGNLPSAPAKTAEQFASKISGRRTAAQLSESRKFARRITQKGAR